MFVATNSHVKTKVGWTLIILSGVPWILMFAIPWIDVRNPVIVTGALYGISQLMWLMGIWCVGREVLTRLKKLLLRNPFCHSTSRIWRQVSQKRLINRQETSGIPHSTVLLHRKDYATIKSDKPSNDISS